MTREELLKPALNVWLQICPNCQQLWIIGSAHADDKYSCKSCGYNFIIGYEHLPPLDRKEKAEVVKH